MSYSVEDETIHRKKKPLNWEDGQLIQRLVSMLPTSLNFARNTCLKKGSRQYSCAIDSAQCVIEACLLSKAGVKFKQNAKGSAAELIESVKESLEWRLRNSYKFKAVLREPFWEILLQHFPQSFKPKGKPLFFK